MLTVSPTLVSRSFCFISLKPGISTERVREKCVKKGLIKNEMCGLYIYNSSPSLSVYRYAVYNYL